MAIIKELYKFCLATYDEPELGNLPPLLEGSIYTRLKNDTDFGFIAEFEDRVIIAFRGSTGGTLKTWLSNFDPYPLRKDKPISRVHDFVHTMKKIKKEEVEDSLRAEGILKNGPWGKGTIHDGFYTAWLFFKKTIGDYVKKVKRDKPILITGHSRGGSLAELCARHIAKNMGRPCSCVQTGAPAVGIRAYRDEYNLLPIHHTLVVVDTDPVPELPPHALGFRHVGSYLHIESGKFWRLYYLSYILRFTNHVPKHYWKAIKRHFG
jgi:predicted lipase